MIRAVGWRSATTCGPTSPTRNERQGDVRDLAPGAASLSPRVSWTLVGRWRSQKVAALPEPIAPAANLNDMDMVQ